MGERLLAIKGRDSTVEAMSEHTRRLIFKVMNGDTSVLPILHLIYNYVRCDEILTWCLRNGITDRRLANTLHFEFQNSHQNMVKYILGKIEREPKAKILYGIDWKP